MVITIASGKGGTGKTTFATNLAYVASRDEQITFLDCDVEEPDAHFYIKPEWRSEEVVTVPIPVVDSERCDGCGKCADFCAYNALAAIVGEVLVFPELCHGCGGCMLACPLKCISTDDRRIGIVRGGSNGNLSVYQGLLDIGEPFAVPVIKMVQEHRMESSIVIADCPPGTGCPMVQTVKGSDYCVLVTEPSPFGKHDLHLAHLACNEMGVPHGVVINRSSENDGIIEEYCDAEGLEILGRIPFSREIAEKCSRGDLLVEEEAWSERFRDMLKVVMSVCLHS